MTTPKRCVVNYARGGWYEQGQARLHQCCDRFGVPFLGFTGDPPCGYSRHDQVPYAFKAACVEAAIRQGFDTICWMDSSAVIQHDPSPIFQIAESLGAFVSQNYGILTGKWSTDACLEEFGLTREEAWKVPHCSALVCAFCPSHSVGGSLWNEYSAAAKKGTALVGPHRATDNPSLFNRWSLEGVEGHRHDQTVLSILAHKYGIPLQPHTFLDYGKERPAVIVAAYPTDNA
jgi:hypothetical protein